MQVGVSLTGVFDERRRLETIGDVGYPGERLAARLTNRVDKQIGAVGVQIIDGHRRPSPRQRQCGCPSDAFASPSDDGNLPVKIQ